MTKSNEGNSVGALAKEHEPITRLERALRLESQARRLYRLIKLKAPEYIIESARMSVAKTLIRFPAAEEMVQMHERTENDTWFAEQDHLHKTGYYADIDAQISALDDPEAATGEQS